MVEGGVGLARDGCLVRSWLFGHAVWLADPNERSDYRWAKRLGVGFASKAIPTTIASEYGGKTLIEKTGKILNEENR